MAHRQRLGAVAAFSILVLVGCASGNSHPSPTASTRSVPSASISVPSQSPTPSATPSPAPTSGLSPRAIQPESVTFVSPYVGWVLGLSLCGEAPCLRLAKTVDAGTDWTWVTTASLSALPTVTQWRLRFADSQYGWISGPLLFATHDAGRTWTRVAFPGAGSPGGAVAALETANGRVYAEIAEGVDPDTYGPVVLFESPTNVDSWHPVSGVTTGGAGFAGEISLAQGVFWATLHPAIVTAQGSQALSTLYRSLDGVTWHSEPQPCPSDSVASVAAATSAQVFVVCAGGGAAGSQEKSAYVSNNGGASYQRVADPPFGGDFEAVAASPTDISVDA